MTPAIAQGLPRLPGPTGYTDDSLASDLRSGSAAGTDLEWVVTRFRLDLVTVISISKLSVKDNFDLARQSKHSFAPTISKAMLAVTNLSSTLVGADKASRINQNRWICGYDSSVEGSAVARLEKILGGLRNLKMVLQCRQNSDLGHGRMPIQICQVRTPRSHLHRLHQSRLVGGTS